MLRANLQRRSGDTYPIKGVIVDADKNPVDLTGAVIVLGYKNKSGSLVTMNGNITDATNGKFEIVPTEDSVNTSGVFPYEIQLTDSNGYKRTIVTGTLRLDEDIVP